MFTKYPYGEAVPAMAIHWNGENTQTGNPTALELAGGFVRIQEESEPAPLEPPERAALALTTQGKNDESVADILTHWFEDANPTEIVGGLHRKFKVAGARAGELLIARACETGVLAADRNRKPRLQLKSRRQKRVETFTRMWLQGSTEEEIAEALEATPSAYDRLLRLDMDDALLDYVEVPKRLATAVLSLKSTRPSKGQRAPRSSSASAESVPRFEPVVVQYDQPHSYANIPQPRTTTTRVLSEFVMNAPVGAPITKSMLLYPFGEADPDIRLRIDGQLKAADKPNLTLGRVGAIFMRGAEVEVQNPSFIDPKGEDIVQLKPEELAALALKNIGLTTSQMHQVLRAYCPKGAPEFAPLLGAYDKLTLYVETRPLTRWDDRHTCDRAGTAAFKNSIYNSKHPPDLSVLGNGICLDRFFKFGPHLAEGKTYPAMIADLGGREAFNNITLAHIRRPLTDIRQRLKVEGSAPLSFLFNTYRFYYSGEVD